MGEVEAVRWIDSSESCDPDRDRVGELESVGELVRGAAIEM